MYSFRYMAAGLLVLVVLAASFALLLHELPAKKGLAVPATTAAERETAAAAAHQPDEESTPPPPSTLQGRALDFLSIAPDEAVGSQATEIAAPGRLNLSAGQVDRLRYVLSSHSIMQADAPDFPLTVGAQVPEGVTLTPLPIEIADVVQDYRAYSYVIAQNRIIIVADEGRTISSLIPL